MVNITRIEFLTTGKATNVLVTLTDENDNEARVVKTDGTGRDLDPAKLEAAAAALWGKPVPALVRRGFKEAGAGNHGQLVATYNGRDLAMAPATTAPEPVAGVIAAEAPTKRKKEPLPLQDGEAIALGLLATTSEKIRYLADKGWKASQVADHLQISYTFAHNVMSAHRKGVKWIKRGKAREERRRRVKATRWMHEVPEFMRTVPKDHQPSVLGFLRWLEGKDDKTS